MPCTEETPCKQPVLRWVHSERCRQLTAAPPPVTKEAQPETYKLRMSIGMALTTNRPELLAIAVAEIEKNPLVVHEQKEVLRLIGNLLKERELHRVKIERLQVRVRQTVMGAKGSINALEKVIDNLNQPEDLQEDGG